MEVTLNNETNNIMFCPENEQIMDMFKLNSGFHSSIKCDIDDIKKEIKLMVKVITNVHSKVNQDYLNTKNEALEYYQTYIEHNKMQQSTNIHLYHGNFKQALQTHESFCRLSHKLIDFACDPTKPTFVIPLGVISKHNEVEYCKYIKQQINKQDMLFLRIASICQMNNNSSSLNSLCSETFNT